VRIVRFDAEVGFDIHEQGSDFRISPLTGPEPSAMRVHVLHLPPGGHIGRHPTGVTQLLCCVDGEGWVTGADGRARRLAPGWGAWWDAGEEHETWSDGGMTAIGVEGELRVLAAVRAGDPIVVVDHDAAWATWFERIRTFLAPALGDLPLSI
jgi:quercetin dioxygenase-like cupin family protein